MFTTIGTPARRPTTRPYRPGLGLWVWSTSTRSRRRIRHSSRTARRSASTSIPRVDDPSGKWRMPARFEPLDPRPGSADPDRVAAARRGPRRAAATGATTGCCRPSSDGPPPVAVRGTSSYPEPFRQRPRDRALRRRRRHRSLDPRAASPADALARFASAATSVPRSPLRDCRQCRRSRDHEPR